MPRSSPPARRRRLALPWTLALALAAVLPFLPAVGADFVWDDRLDILTLPADGPARPSPTQPLAGPGPYHRPLVFASYALEHHLWGGSPAPYHLFNLLLHSANTTLLFAAALSSGVSLAGAVVGAAVFAVHPVQTEAVAYVSGRTDLLCTLGALVAVLGVLAGPRHGRGGEWLRGWTIGLAVAASVLTKETGYALVVLVPWLAWRRRRERRWWPALAAPAVGLVLFAVRPVSLPAFELAAVSAVLAAAGRTVLEYAALLLWPGVLMIDRMIPVPRAGAEVLVCALAAIGLAAAAAFGLLRREAAGVWTAWSVALYLPVANALPLYPEIATRELFAPEHNLYGPLAGIGILLGLGVARLRGGVSPRAARVGAAVIGLLLLACAGRSWARASEWRDERTLFRAAAGAGSRSPRVWFNLGNVLMQVPDRAGAIQAYEAASGLAPGDAEIWLNLAVAMQLEGRHPEALAAYGRSLALRPSALAWENLGTLHLARGDVAAARGAFASALALDPGRDLARRGLGATGETGRDSTRR